MNKTYTAKLVGFGVTLSLMTVCALIPARSVYADPSTTQVKCNDGTTQTASRSGSAFTQADYEAACKDHGGYTTPTVDTACNIKGDCANSTAYTFNNKNKNVSIRDVAVEILKFLSVAVGLAVVGGIAAGGIVYSTAQGSPGKTQSGIKIITNSVIALVLYLLMFAILQFLIPGGIL